MGWDGLGWIEQRQTDQFRKSRIGKIYKYEKFSIEIMVTSKQ